MVQVTLDLASLSLKSLACLIYRLFVSHVLFDVTIYFPQIYNAQKYEINIEKYLYMAFVFLQNKSIIQFIQL